MSQSKSEQSFFVKLYSGITNPSGAVALTNKHFIVADDEINSLRIYDKTVTDRPLQTIALTNVFNQGISDAAGQEIDLEGATELDGRLFWIGSHSANKNGKSRPARHRLLAVRVNRDDNSAFVASAEGAVYKKLIADLARDSRFDAYHFDKAGKLPPKETGALSIEGLAATANHGLLIGFRNPLSGGKIEKDRLVDGKALLVNLLNPFDVIHGKPPRFADPIELDLDGFGIRDIARRKKYKYLIVAGPYHDNQENEDHKTEKTHLFSWSAKSGKLKKLKKFDLKDLNIEAAFFYPDSDKKVQLLSDDGKLGATKGFRSIEVEL